MKKNEIKELKNSINSMIDTNPLNEIVTKNFSLPKDMQTVENKNFTPKNKSSSSNNIFSSVVDEKKSKSSSHNKNKKKEKNEINKNKKKYKDRLSNILKGNEKVKIPIGKKRRSIGNEENNRKLNLNNVNNIVKSLTPPKEIIIRKDKNGIEINKDNKKKVHITFLDQITPYNKITETVNIPSFKKFNIQELKSSEPNKLICSKCCNIY
jgi:hypothetical protein